MLNKLHDSKFSCSRHTFVASAVMKNEVARIGIFGFHLFAAFCDDDFDTTSFCPSLQEHILHRTRADNPFGINHSTFPTSRELSRLTAGEVGLSLRSYADSIDSRQRFRANIHRKPTDAECQRDYEQEQWPVETARTDPARHHCRHFTVAIQAAERKHDRQKHANRQHNRKILQTGQRNYLKNSIFWQSVFGDVAQDLGKLIGQQDKQQHESHGSPGLRHLAKYVSIKNTKHRYICDFIRNLCQI